MTSPEFIFRFASISAPTASAPTTDQPTQLVLATPPASSPQQNSADSATPAANEGNPESSPSVQSQASVDQTSGEVSDAKPQDLRGQGAPIGQVAAGQHARGSWYYCDPLKAYYPYVRMCPTPWRAVTPAASNPSSLDSRPTEAASPPTQLPSSPN